MTDVVYNCIMNVVISSSLLGTADHLVCHRDKFTWSNMIPDSSWKLGFKNEPRDLTILADATGVELSTFDSNSHGKAARLIYGDEIIPWMYVLPRDLFHKQLQLLLDQLWMLLEDESNGYYMNQFLVNREIIMGLCDARVDVNLIQQMIIDNDKKVHDIKRFLPEQGNMAPRTIYSQTGSVTGRLTVTSGPNILTLKKEKRKILKSRFEGGKIVQIDISSLEPRIALALAESDQPDDIYEHTGETILDGRLDRDQVKIAILNCIYGGTRWSLSKRLPSDLDIESIMSSIMRYFKIDDLKNRLYNESIEKGYIENLYGRPIKLSDAVVNHFLQSSGVDVSFNVFSKMMKKLSKLGIEFIPIYIIHDAIVLDIPSESYDKVMDAIRYGFVVDKLDCTFPVKLEIIRE